MLAESVHDDEFQVRKSLDDLFEFIAEKWKIALLEDADEVNAIKDLL